MVFKSFILPELQYSPVIILMAMVSNAVLTFVFFFWYGFGDCHRFLHESSVQFSPLFFSSSMGSVIATGFSMSPLCSFYLCFFSRYGFDDFHQPLREFSVQFLPLFLPGMGSAIATGLCMSPLCW